MPDFDFILRTLAQRWQTQTSVGRRWSVTKFKMAASKTEVEMTLNGKDGAVILSLQFWQFQT